MNLTFGVSFGFRHEIRTVGVRDIFACRSGVSRRGLSNGSEVAFVGAGNVTDEPDSPGSEAICQPVSLIVGWHPDRQFVRNRVCRRIREALESPGGSIKSGQGRAGWMLLPILVPTPFSMVLDGRIVPSCCGVLTRSSSAEIFCPRAVESIPALARVPTKSGSLLSTTFRHGLFFQIRSRRRHRKFGQFHRQFVQENQIGGCWR